MSWKSFQHQAQCDLRRSAGQRYRVKSARKRVSRKPARANQIKRAKAVIAFCTSRTEQKATLCAIIDKAVFRNGRVLLLWSGNFGRARASPCFEQQETRYNVGATLMMIWLGSAGSVVCSFPAKRILAVCTPSSRSTSASASCFCAPAICLASVSRCFGLHW